MNPTRYLIPALALICIPFAAFAGKSIVIPGQWIVELEHAPTLQYGGPETAQSDGQVPELASLAATRPALEAGERFDPHSPEVLAYVQFLDRQKERMLDGMAATVGRNIEPELIFRHVKNGFMVRMSTEEAERIARLPGVRSVSPDIAWKLELDRGPTLIGAPALWNASGALRTRGEGVVIGIIDTGINWDHRYFSDSTTHTGGYVHQNPLGEQLGLCDEPEVHCNNKLIGVYDFAAEGTAGKDPDEAGHGTHVASIAAGNPWTFSLSGVGGGSFATSGVAPRANIISYKVCYHKHPSNDDLDGRCVGSEIAKALEQAISDGVDVVNYSIGGDADNPWTGAQAFLNVRNAGITFVTSAGNSGPADGSITRPANAPWTFAVGNSTHGRRIGHSATVAGISDLFVEPGTGPKLESDITAPVIAADSAGGSLEGCSNYPANAFEGAIAYIRRGGCTFRTKVNNAHAAGAVAALIYNHEPGGPVVIMAELEATQIPAGFIDNQQGQQAYEAIKATSNPTATYFEEERALFNLAWQDQVAETSARGPGANAPGVMKPNVTAPGSSILGGGVPDSNSISILSGTSMASPHVAGAVALLKSIHADWTPSMLQSALETTAEADPVRVGLEAATQLDRGAGRIRVDRAARAGLYLPVSGSDFLAANPQQGGDPQQLNLPGMLSMACADLCTFTRTVRAMTSGSWTVSTEGDLDISVSPQSFNLDAGEQRTLTIEVRPGSVPSGTFGDGAVVLTPGDSALATQRLPAGALVQLADVPDGLQIDADNNRGQATLTIPSAGAMTEPVYQTSDLILPVRSSLALGQDSSPEDPYDDTVGTETILVNVPEDALMLYVEVVEAMAETVDLFVGRDSNGNFQADASEEVCRAVSESETETCIISLPEAGRWWILVQNVEAVSLWDQIDLEYAVISESDDYSLTAIGPARHDEGSLDIHVYFDQPAMRQNERWLGAIAISSSPDMTADIGMSSVSVTREVEKTAQPTVLFHGETRPVVIGPQATDNLTYFDVPPGSGNVIVQVIGDAGVEAELLRMSFDHARQASPVTPLAAGEVLGSASGSSAGFQVTSNMAPGRWYVVLKNTIATEVKVDVTVTLEESEPNISQRGLWSPLERPIRQGIEWQRAGPAFVTWYSYDRDGLPTFYQAIEALDPNSSVWRAPIYRITNATGVRQNADVVGEMSLTMLDDDAMVFAWRMEGFHGSDLMKPDAALTCPEINGSPFNVSGHWNAPGTNMGGTTMIVNHAVQAHIRYYFDDEGIGRWLFASDPEQDPLNQVLELVDFRGYCPSCNESTITHEVVGLYMREYASQTSGKETLDFVTAPPLNHEISFEINVSKFSEAMTCQ